MVETNEMYAKFGVLSNLNTKLQYLSYIWNSKVILMSTFRTSKTANTPSF